MINNDIMFIATISVMAKKGSQLLEPEGTHAFMNVVCPSSTTDFFMEEVRQMAEYYQLKIIEVTDLTSVDKRFPDGPKDKLVIEKIREATDSKNLRIIRLHVAEAE